MKKGKSKMVKVINKYLVEMPGKMGIHTVHGICEKCGTEVSRSQYGRDEDCPICNEMLDCGSKNWGDD